MAVSARRLVQLAGWACVFGAVAGAAATAVALDRHLAADRILIRSCNALRDEARRHLEGDRRATRPPAPTIATTEDER